MTQSMTKADRTELGSLIRKREKVMKAAADERASKMLAEFEGQSARIYSFNEDAVWEQATLAAKEAVQAAQKMMAPARAKDDPVLGAGGRRRLSITDALAWAYQVELPSMERYVSGEVESHSSHPMWNLGRVDGGGANWDDAAIARIVDRDALRVGQAVASLRDPTWAATADLTGFEVFQPGLSLSEAAFIGPALERAETLVITHAKLGTVPDVEGQQTIAVRAGNGSPLVRREVPFREATISGDTLTRIDEEHVPDQPMIMLRGKPTRGKWPEGSFCLVDYWPSAHAIMRDRAEYLVWRAALDWLTVHLQGLDRIDIGWCDVQKRPWT